jgi:hypothetical protein
MKPGDRGLCSLIAIMLGRLEMDVDECITAFRETMQTVFEKKTKTLFPLSLLGDVRARFSSKTLEEAIKNVISSRHGLREDDPMYDQLADKDASRKCRVCVNIHIASVSFLSCHYPGGLS